MQQYKEPVLGKANAVDLEDHAIQPNIRLAGKRNDKRMAKDTGAGRAPRGTKTVTRAFFAAADEIAEAHRPAVIKAALAAIRDELKVVRERAALAKAKAKTRAKITREPAAAPLKAVAKALKKTPASTTLEMRATKAPPKKPGRKARPPAVTQHPVSEQASQVTGAKPEV